MREYFNILQKCPLFYGIVENELEAILGCLGAKVIDFTKKEAILHEGDRAEWIGIILSGRAQIIRVDYYGNKSIVANVESSELFGESFACADVKEIPVDVIANEDSKVLRIDHFRITKPCSNACDFHRKLIENLLRVVAAKNLLFHQKIEVTSKKTTREKLMTYLLLQAKKHGSSFDIPFDRQGLADYLGVERSGLSVEISKLRAEGVLKSKRNHFELL